MNVQFLHPNIDHKESIDACSHVLGKRTNQSFPSRVIVKLIQLILKCNVMSFNGLFFHQIKGTAMGTPMAVSCANIFLSEFEQRLLHDYEQRYKRKPALWLKFIGDIILVWIGDKASLKSFLKYCNEYGKSRDMLSNIKFLYSYTLSTVSFLDVKVTKLMYIGQTGDVLNCRFNRHRSDIFCYPNRCELPKHFHYRDCSFETDLSVFILEKVKGSEYLHKYKEDQWIIRLDTLYPYGLSMHISDFGLLYSSFFK